ncbi:hypothetical protein ANN_05314 [Periplaneta americana]|uniref:Uncharacterized protein n=1 Tax=Periplaneta americana TaxID=6978 RepID=A0ABQ8TDB5_PERAM|nr:hypothetical protein ANN_05314 [Periplaneta americana]
MIGKSYKRLRVRDRVMSWHGTCTSGTSRVLSVASLHWLKMDAPIPAPAECEVWSIIKFLNAQGIAPIEIDRQLCQVYGPDIMSKQMVRCSTRSSVMMVGLPLHSSSCTFWRPAENCLQQQRTICLPIKMAQLTINFNRRYAL